MFSRNKKKPMDFLILVYCASCGNLFHVSRMGMPCIKCGASPDYVTRASTWQVDKAFDAYGTRKNWTRKKNNQRRSA